jgi:hypothetical protein
MEVRELIEQVHTTVFLLAGARQQHIGTEPPTSAGIAGQGTHAERAVAGAGSARIAGSGSLRDDELILDAEARRKIIRTLIRQFNEAFVKCPELQGMLVLFPPGEKAVANSRCVLCNVHLMHLSNLRQRKQQHRFTRTVRSLLQGPHIESP